MPRLRRVCRRNVLLILLIIAALIITYYEMTKEEKKEKAETVGIQLPKVPNKLSNFLQDSQREMQESIGKMMRIKSPSSLRMEEHFDGVSEDGFNLPWVHESDFHIPLKTESNSMVDLHSVMDKAGYINIDTLDALLKEGRHGLCLPLYSLGQAKVALAALTTRPFQIKAPLLISAKVLQGPNIVNCRKEKLCSYSEPIALESVVSLVKKDLRPQLGLSWTEYFDPKNVNQGYTWPMVIQMLEAVREVKSDNLPVLFMVRATLAKASIPQLKWLIQVTKNKLVLEASKDDAKVPYLGEDLALIYKILPKSSVYLRAPEKLRSEVSQALTTFRMAQEWTQYLDKRYKDHEWKVMRENDNKYFLRSDDSVLMYPSANHPVYFGTLQQFSLVPRKLTQILGRVQFFEDSEYLKTGKLRSGLKIYFDTDFSSIGVTDTQLVIGANGYFSLSSFASKRDVIMIDKKLKEPNPCYEFHLEVEPRGVDVRLSSPIDCNHPLEKKVMHMTKMRLDITLSTKPFSIYIQPIGNEPVLVEEFKVIEPDPHNTLEGIVKDDTD